MSKAAEARFVNAEFALRYQSRQLDKQIRKTKTAKDKAMKKLLQLMKEGDEQRINGQAEVVANLDSRERSMISSKDNLDMSIAKCKDAMDEQKIGAGMVAASRALSQVTKNINLANVEQSMEDLAKQYEDIDVMSSVLKSATRQSTARDVSQEQIDQVKRMVADQAGIELSQELNNAAMDTNSVKTAPIKTGPTAEDETKMADKLKALRQAA